MNAVFFPEFVGGVLDGQPAQTMPADATVICVPGRPPLAYYEGGIAPLPWPSTEVYVRREISMDSSVQRLYAWVDTNLPPSYWQPMLWQKLLNRAGCVRAL